MKATHCSQVFFHFSPPYFKPGTICSNRSDRPDSRSRARAGRPAASHASLRGPPPALAPPASVELASRRHPPSSSSTGGSLPRAPVSPPFSARLPRPWVRLKEGGAAGAVSPPSLAAAPRTFSGRPLRRDHLSPAVSAHLSPAVSAHLKVAGAAGQAFPPNL